MIIPERDKGIFEQEHFLALNPSVIPAGIIVTCAPPALPATDKLVGRFTKIGKRQILYNFL